MITSKNVLPPEKVAEFHQGQNKIAEFKVRFDLYYREIGERAGMCEKTVSILLGHKHPEVTATMMNNLDKIIECFHINPYWAYGESQVMMSDLKALKPEDICYDVLRTPQKKRECIYRLEMAREVEAITNAELAKLAGLSEPSVSAYLAKGNIPKRFIKALLVYCGKHKINPKWLFFGVGEMRKDNFWEYDRRKKRRVEKKKWYVVNYSEVHFDSWILFPERYQIKKAREAKDVAKTYPIRRVEIKSKSGKYIDDVIITERAIGRYDTESEAIAALEKEKRRIKFVGNNAWIAPWANEVIR